MRESVTGTVTIASEALVTIVRLAAQEIPGVHEMSADWARDVNRFLGNAQVGEGVRVQVYDNHQVSVDLFVIVDHDVNIFSVIQVAAEVCAVFLYDVHDARVQLDTIDRIDVIEERGKHILSTSRSYDECVPAAFHMICDRRDVVFQRPDGIEIAVKFVDRC